jgi:plasmid stabilization system protein ParE
VGKEYKVIFGPRARTDLRDVVRYIALGSGSSDVAERFGKMLLERALSLSKLPERGRVVPELELAEVREIIFKSYRIVYRVSETSVQILRFWHAARGAPELTIDDFT